MTSVLLQPRCDGVDGVSLRNLRDWSAIPAAGYGWASVYLGGNYGVTSVAIEAAWDAGIPLMLNYERNPGDAKKGYPAGKLAAQTALAQAKALGFQGEAPLPFSAADEGFADSELAAGLAYHRALVDVFTPEGWVGGAYGLKKLMELLPQQSWWPEDWPIWHWGGDGYTIYDWAWAKQWYGRAPLSVYSPPKPPKPNVGFTVDENTLLKPMKFWSGYGADKPPDPDPQPPLDPQEEPMTDAEVNLIVSRVVTAVSADTRSQINGFLGGDPAHAREGEYSNNLKASVREVLKEVPPGAIDLGAETNQQAIIRAVERVTGDLTIVANEPYDGTFHFKQS